MEEKGIEFRLLSPALRNLWLLLVNKYRSDGAFINIDKIAALRYKVIWWLHHKNIINVVVLKIMTNFNNTK